MILIRLLRWLRGSVGFLIFGRFPERLLNLCTRERISLWGVVPREGGYEANTYLSQYRRIRPLARKSKTRAHVISRHGWPFLRYRYRRRWGIAAGVVLALALTLFLSSRIWSVEVTGCETLDPQQITEQLSGLGLRPGVRTSELDARKLQRQMMLLNDGIGWISINLIGSTAHIELKERVMPPERLDPADGAANVVADSDGQIRYLEIYEGQAMVRVGDTVRKGDVIVSGIMEDQYQNTRVIYARAKVIAQVYEERTVEVPLEQETLRAAGEPVFKRYLLLPGVRFPLNWGQEPDGEVERKAARRTLLTRPLIELEEVTVTPMERVAETLTEFEAKERAMALLREQVESIDKTEVISGEMTARCENGVFTLTAQYMLERDIARTVEIPGYQ